MVLGDLRERHANTRTHTHTCSSYDGLTERSVELNEEGVGQDHGAGADVDNRAQLAGELQHRALHNGAADPGDEAGCVV